MNSSILVFEVRGRYAHFRDMSTNSSALTYLFPPRTSVIGLLGALLGREDYPLLFSPKNCDIAVGIEGMHRKFTDTFKYLKIKSTKQWENQIDKNPTLVPIELIKGEGLKGLVEYRIYIRHKNEKVLDEIEGHIESHRMHYPISLGKANLSCGAYFIDRTTDYFENDSKEVTFSSVVPKDLVKKIDPFKDTNDNRRYQREQAQRVMDMDRTLREVREYLVPINGKGIYVKEVLFPYITVNIDRTSCNIAWL